MTQMTEEQRQSITEEIQQFIEDAFATNDNPRAYGGDQGVNIKIYTYNDENGQPKWYGTEVIRNNGIEEENSYCGEIPDHPVDKEEMTTIWIGTAPTVDPNNFYWSEDDEENYVVKDANNNDHICTEKDLREVWKDNFRDNYDNICAEKNINVMTKEEQQEAILKEVEGLQKDAFLTTTDRNAYGGNQGIRVKIYTYNDENGKMQWYGKQLIGWDPYKPRLTEDNHPTENYCGKIPDYPVDEEKLTTVTLHTAPRECGRFSWDKDKNGHDVVIDLDNNHHICTATDLEKVWQNDENSVALYEPFREEVKDALLEMVEEPGNIGIDVACFLLNNGETRWALSYDIKVCKKRGLEPLFGEIPDNDDIEAWTWGTYIIEDCYENFPTYTRDDDGHLRYTDEAPRDLIGQLVSPEDMLEEIEKIGAIDYEEDKFSELLEELEKETLLRAGINATYELADDYIRGEPGIALKDAVVTKVNNTYALFKKSDDTYIYNKGELTAAKELERGDHVNLSWPEGAPSATVTPVPTQKLSR